MIGQVSGTSLKVELGQLGFYQILRGRFFDESLRRRPVYN